MAARQYQYRVRAAAAPAEHDATAWAAWSNPKWAEHDAAGSYFNLWFAYHRIDGVDEDDYARAPITLGDHSEAPRRTWSVTGVDVEMFHQNVELVGVPDPPPWGRAA